MTAQIIYTDRFRKPREKLKLAFRRSIEAEERSTVLGSSDDPKDAA